MLFLIAVLPQHCNLTKKYKNKQWIKIAVAASIEYRAEVDICYIMVETDWRAEPQGARKNLKNPDDGGTEIQPAVICKRKQ